MSAVVYTASTGHHGGAMLLRAKPLIIGFTLALTQAACDGLDSKCEPVESAVEPIGPELFTVDYMDVPGSVALFRDGDQVQLLEGTSEIRATLSAAAIASIEDAKSALGSGEGLGSFDPACLTFIDRPNVQLSLGVIHAALSFRYPWGCPPSGLVEIDTVLRELVVALPTCSPTPLVTDCELIGE
jgi:hypothetical protein